jgi:hypothetical protein
MALVKINPQNDLGDITSELCVKFNPFRVIIPICFFIYIFYPNDFAGKAHLSSYLWPR